MTSVLFSSYGLVAVRKGTLVSAVKAMLTFIKSLAYLEICKHCMTGSAGFFWH